MKKFIIALVIAAFPALALAAGGDVKLMKADVDLEDQASLQRGARLFVNYCLSCHSAQFMRYNRMGQDLNLSEDLVKDNLMFAAEKIGDTMTVAMPAADATRWFGTPPPDLSVIARSRGADWLYTYFKTFYVDEGRPFGVNNLVFPDVGMPHVLWELEGLKKPVYEVHQDAEGHEVRTVSGYETVVPGQMSAMEYDAAVKDLVNFLVYMGEPAQLDRKRLGVWVLLYLVLLLIPAYYLKKEYWKDVH